MEADQPEEVAVKREAEPQSEGRVLKRKKTVTWADDELELPLGPPSSAEKAADSADGGGQAAVVVLPCDGLFDSLTMDLLQQQVYTPPQQSEPLSRRQLLERRLQHTEQLTAVYKSELWVLLEELKLRHDQFVQQPGLSAWKDGSEPAQQAQRPLPPLQQEQEPAAGSAEADAPSISISGGCSLRELWQRRQRGGEENQQQAKQEGAAAAGASSSPAGAAAGGTAAGAASGAQPPDQQPQQGDQQLPCYDDVEQLILSGGAAGCTVDEAALVQQRRRFVQQLGLVGRLEQSALAATCRELDTLGGLAVLCGRRCRYVLRRAAVAIGRDTESRGKVDVDLSQEGSAQRISRQQAQLFLEADGAFRLRCTGRRGMLVNGCRLAQGQQAALPTLSHIKVGDVSLLFIANNAAVQRAVNRSALLAA